jgi:hypothetical protein
MLPADTELSDKNTIFGVKGSFITRWAKVNGVNLTEIDGSVTKTGYDDIWLKVPYQYIIETMMPDNVELEFAVVGGALPDGLNLMEKGDVYGGLTMLSGQFYGAPLETGVFTFVVEVYSKVWGYLLDMQQITVTVTAPADADLAVTNDYDITLHIGAPGVPGIDGDYWVRAAADQILRVADTDLNRDGAVDSDDNNYPYFTHFWIDGQVRTLYLDYTAGSGSTVITLLARVLPDLDDGQVHIAAAEFNIYGVQTVAAQRFRVDLPDADSGAAQPTDSAVQPTEAPVPTDSATQPTGTPRPTDSAAQPTSGPRPTGSATQPTGAPRPTDSAAQPTGAPRPTDSATQPTGAPQPTDSATQPTNAPRPTGSATQPTSAPRPTDSTTQPTGVPRPTGSATQPTNVPQPTDSASQPTGAARPTDSAPRPTDSATRPTNSPQRPALPADDSGTGGGNSDSEGNGGSGANNDSGGANNSSGASGVFSANNRVGADASVNENGGVSGSDRNGAGADEDIDTETANTGEQTASVLTQQPESAGTSAVPAPVLALGSVAVVDTDDENGETADGGNTDAYAIDYDGAGPFEARIDIPIEEFRELYFDGAIWARGVDYEVRSGSTILTIPEARLNRVAEGSHRISAIFDGQSVDIDFVLQRTATSEALAPVAESVPVTAAPATAEDFLSIPMIGLVLAAGAAAVLGTRIIKQRKMVKA